MSWVQRTHNKILVAKKKVLLFIVQMNLPDTSRAKESGTGLKPESNKHRQTSSVACISEHRYRPALWQESVLKLWAGWGAALWVLHSVVLGCVLATRETSKARWTPEAQKQQCRVNLSNKTTVCSLPYCDCNFTSEGSLRNDNLSTVPLSFASCCVYLILYGAVNRN
jgi:hypothetical protein